MKQYSIIISSRAKKDIDRLPENIKSRIKNILINILAKNPFIGKALKAELKGLYLYRAGDYRIVYSILRKELVIQLIKVMHRREAYR